MARLIEDDPVQFIVELFETTKRWRQPYEDRWKKFYKLYRSYRDESKYPFKSNIFVPYIFSIVESVVPKMLGTIFNTRPIVSAQPRKGASIDLAKVMERLLEYQLDEEQLEFFVKILEFFKECSIYGTSFLKVVPRFNDDELVSFNYIDVEPIDLFNIFPDYRAKSVRRMKHIIQLSYRDYDDLETSGKQGFYKNVKDCVHFVESMATVDQYKRERLTDIGILDEYGYDAKRKIVEVLEYWDKDKIYTIGARKVVLKEEDNPFGGLLPFIMARYIPVQHELYGIGIPEVSEVLQEELNTVRNQRMDNVNLIINRMFIANKYADINFDQLVSYPGNVILTNDVNAIQPLDTRDITKSAYMEEEIIKRDIDNAVGEYEYSRGALPPRKETATGIVRLQQAANVRFDTVVKMLEFTVIRHIAKMFLWLDYQFLPKDELKKILGEEDYTKLNAEAFYGQDIETMLKQYNFQPMGSSTTAIKEVRIQQIMQAYKLFNMDPMIDQLELRKMVIDVLDLKNESRLLKPLPPPQLMPPGAGGEQPGAAGQPKGGTAGTGPQPPQPPAPPQPGTKALTPVQQMAEMARIAGGGLIKSGQPGVIEERQFGGDVEAGKSYLIGEQGPEVFVPSTEGYILPQVIPNEQVDRSQWPLRQDGTPKGFGWLGVLPNAFGGVSSELTAGVSFDGKEYLIPTMVPTLDAEELNYILTTPSNPEMFKTPMGKKVLDKAIEHAQKRLQMGLSPFKD